MRCSRLVLTTAGHGAVGPVEASPWCSYPRSWAPRGWRCSGRLPTSTAPSAAAAAIFRVAILSARSPTRRTADRRGERRREWSPLSTFLSQALSLSSALLLRTIGRIVQCLHETHIVHFKNTQGIKVFADGITLEAESRRRALHDQVPSNIYQSKVLFSLKNLCLLLQF